MKIAFFTDNFYPEIGGIQDSIEGIARELGARGHIITIFAPRARKADFLLRKLPPGEISLGPNVVIRRLPAVPFPSPTLQSAALVPTGLGAILLGGKDRPDIIHAHTFFSAGVEALFAAKILHIPFVGTNHWAFGEFLGYVPFFGRGIEQQALTLISAFYNQAVFVSAPSQSVVDEMRKHGFRKPTRVISNPIIPDFFKQRSPEAEGLKKRWGLSPHTFVFAGRLAEEKDIDVLIRALVYVRRAVPDAVLAIAGHGAHQEKLRRLSSSLGVEHAVRFVGTLTHAELVDLFHASEVFAISSRSETQSMVLVQAMAAGLPAVGVRARALPEYIKEGLTGSLVAPGDETAMAREIVSLFSDKKRAFAWGMNGRKFAESFAGRVVADAWEQLYEDVVLKSVVSM